MLYKDHFPVVRLDYRRFGDFHGVDRGIVPARGAASTYSEYWSSEIAFLKQWQRWFEVNEKQILRCWGIAFITQVDKGDSVSSTRTIDSFVVDDHQVVRIGAKTMFENVPGFVVAGCDGASADRL